MASARFKSQLLGSKRAATIRGPSNCTGCLRRTTLACALPPESSSSSAARPSTPRSVVLSPGELATLELTLQSGSVELVGRLIDTNGDPIADVPFVCWLDLPLRALGAEQRVPAGLAPLASGTTEATGHFRLSGLPAARVAVRLDPGEFEFPWRAALAAGHAPVIVDLADQVGDVVLPPTTAHPTRSFVVRGQVVLDPSWQANEQLSLADLTVQAIASGPAGSSDAPKENLPALLDPASGQFELGCATPRERLELLLRCPRLGLEKRLMFTPSPGESLDSQTVTFP